MIRDLELRTWQRVRRYAVPVTMIERCTERRLVGDWRGACAAGRIDIAFTDAEARPFESELSELAPDLLRWHLPRVLGGRTTLATGDVYVLSLAERIEPGGPVLTVSMPKTVDGSQRLTLGIEADSREFFDLPPRLWSASQLAPQRDSAPWPLDEAGVVQAWRDAGIELGTGIPESKYWYDRGPSLARLAEMPLNPAGIAQEVRRLALRYGGDRAGLYVNWNLPLALEVDARGEVAAEFTADLEEIVVRRRRIGEAVFRRPADPDLLRFGMITPAELHPLVREALSLPDGPAPSTSDAWARTVRVRCRGAWHEIEHRDGQLVLASHGDDEVRREQALRGLGGEVAGCFAVRQAWAGTAGQPGGRLPRPLRLHRREIMQHIMHGGSEAMLRLLDDGIDPRMRDGRSATLLHHLRCVDHTKVLPRLLRAGLDLEARDCRGRTPLHAAVADGGSPELVLALLEAGADPNAAEDNGWTVVRLSKSKTYYGPDEEDSAVQRNHRLVTEWADKR